MPALYIAVLIRIKYILIKTINKQKTYLCTHMHIAVLTRIKYILIIT